MPVWTEWLAGRVLRTIHNLFGDGTPSPRLSFQLIQSLDDAHICKLARFLLYACFRPVAVFLPDVGPAASRTVIGAPTEVAIRLGDHRWRSIPRLQRRRQSPNEDAFCGVLQ